MVKATGANHRTLIMHTKYGDLTYCTNIHAGESWSEHFQILRENIPAVKKAISPNTSFGIGLRLANTASLELSKEENLRAFLEWLAENDCYVFTMNGFPYGGFHRTRVKDQVHAPDWTTNERVQYTIRLFRILAAILPEEADGGISTSPLSYKHWHKDESEFSAAMEKATWNILVVLEQLIQIKKTSGKLLHLDIEPEPDGLVENGPEFLDWYNSDLLSMGIPYLKDRFNVDDEAARGMITDHIRLCYDVCHFAVGYEDHASIIKQLFASGIQIGKIQISAALKALLPYDAESRSLVTQAFHQFNESVYLHQVIAKNKAGTLTRYPDLPDALNDAANNMATEWRAHFHVPLFVQDYGALQSTQSDIREVLSIHKDSPLTTHLEVETYTWEVLPEELKLPLTESITREMQWVMNFLK
jgi:hypothetical protein